MIQPGPRQERLRRHARRVLARFGRTRDEIERRRGQPPRPGEVFAFAATAGCGVLWAVVDHDAGRLLVVAADMGPQVGSGDVAVDAEAPSGALTLRCAIAAWLGERHFAAARRVSFLAPADLGRARHRRRAIESQRPAARMC